MKFSYKNYYTEMNQIEQTFKDNIDVGLDQLDKGIIDEFTTSVIPFPWLVDVIESKYKYNIDRTYIDNNYEYSFVYKSGKKKLYIGGNFIQGPIKIKFKNES